MKSGADGDGPVAIALAYVSALGGTDPDEVTRLVADDFRNEHTAELGTGCVGLDEYARRLPNFFAMFPNRNYEIEETAVGAIVDTASRRDAVAAEVVVRYRFGADVHGTRIDIPGVMWISVGADGLINRRLDCWDSLTYYRQTGTTGDI